MYGSRYYIEKSSEERKYSPNAKSVESFLTQSQIGKLSKCEKANQELSIDSAGPFQNATGTKKEINVSVDH